MGPKGLLPGQLKGAYGSAEELGGLLSLIESGEDVWGDLPNNRGSISEGRHLTADALTP